MDGIGLADAIAVLHAELRTARSRAANEDIQFPIQSLTVQMKVGLERLADGKVGFKIPLIGAEVGAVAGLHEETTQTVTLQIGPPTDRQNRPLQVNQESAQQKG